MLILRANKKVFFPNKKVLIPNKKVLFPNKKVLFSNKKALFPNKKVLFPNKKVLFGDKHIDKSLQTGQIKISIWQIKSSTYTFAAVLFITYQERQRDLAR